MRLTPAQLGMHLMLGRHGIGMGHSESDLVQRIRDGRKWLLKVGRGEDFGYDALRWHDYLWDTDFGGYKWCRRSREKWERYVRDGMAVPGWAEAVRQLEAEERHPQ